MVGTLFGGFGGPATPVLLLIGLLLDAAAGHWIGRVLGDPSALSARVCGLLDRRINRPERGDTALMMRGAVVVLALLLAALLLGLAVEWAGGQPQGWILELVVVLACVRGRAAWVRVRAVRRALEDGGLAAARMEVAAMTRRPIQGLDEHGVVRAAVEHAAKAFDRRVVAPAFWYLLLGVPGMLAWAFIDGADRALGHPGVRHERFGHTAARLDDALNAIPARLAGVLLALAAPFLGTASVGGAFRTLGRDAGKHPSFNMGWPVAATAGALDLALGGPHRDGGVTVDEPWIGRGKARATAADIGRVLGLTALGDLLVVLVAGLLTVATAL
ncbi:CobD/CbiB family cobalamin biosynthesis protein [Azospirillum sp. TSO22-1]|uniref:CobD/CbiB family cobalamin biosynthesis protein n=1 Tax=Azospirillum sp. TSO22-1 TaxID=716789 RepID=UPI000D61EA64|nr:CobD/CbiB family cobalamin biosynthesis protein [Azospirillum sp. TSO22-1]PWC56167.1 cobalamin biosynthesis protein [Azospirillum sp. TSO22-1]